MSPDIRVGWTVVLFLAALAAGMGVSSVAHCEPSPLIERVAALVPVFGSKKEPLVDAAGFASAVVSVSGGNRDWTALLATVAIHEAALSARIADGNCRPLECDHGLAWSLYQIHRNQQNSAVWGSRDLTVQTREASRMLRQAFYRCGGLHDGWLLQTLRAYAGHGCASPFPGETERVATFVRVRSRL